MIVVVTILCILVAFLLQQWYHHSKAMKSAADAFMAMHAAMQAIHEENTELRQRLDKLELNDHIKLH